MKRSVVLVAVGLVCLAIRGEARQTPAQAPPTFRAAVELVQLDVTVLDKDHHPVTGLAQSDLAPRYSSRNSASGSTRIARRAGVHDASVAVRSSTIDTTMNDKGSDGSTR